MVVALFLYRALARDGDALRARVEAAHLRAYRSDSRRSDLRLAGSARRREELGLSLHLDSRCSVHHLWILAVGLLRRGHALYGMAARPHSGESGDRAAAGDVPRGWLVRPDGIYARSPGRV